MQNKYIMYHEKSRLKDQKPKAVHDKSNYKEVQVLRRLRQKKN